MFRDLDFLLLPRPPPPPSPPFSFRPAALVRALFRAKVMPFIRRVAEPAPREGIPRELTTRELHAALHCRLVQAQSELGTTPSTSAPQIVAH